MVLLPKTLPPCFFMGRRKEKKKKTFILFSGWLLEEELRSTVNVRDAAKSPLKDVDEVARLGGNGR